MADPGEPAEVICEQRMPTVTTAVVASFLKYPQFLIVKMTELHLCAHDHSFVPPW